MKPFVVSVLFAVAVVSIQELADLAFWPSLSVFCLGILHARICALVDE